MAENKSLENMMEEILATSEPGAGDGAAVPSSGRTVIDEDVLIRGDITAHSDVIVYGSVEGNITSENWNVIVYGTVHGNVDGRSLQLEQGNIEGNITVREWVTAQDDTDIKGDITAMAVGLAGHSEGTIQAEKNLEMYETAVIIGDVKAGSISIAPGSMLRGKMDIGFDDTPAPAKKTSDQPEVKNAEKPAKSAK